ncbi:conserved Plasmodium protein, unknown function [Plasmodium gallinaceum]|uniref:Uncharacterized protein n=1 Tax=Plasmodium gallinaceum TaxID=5849 RepID=A0A1J1GQV6_PLAGA|nr:conserved Plasmodium protein, unknown function [Plasmodium gallinaceum]CRG94808.1 conserved Plasmodium protein, unknown function [Plasmodium gallinaceum]
MNENNNISDVYEKNLLLASIRREAKENMEISDLKKFKRDIFDSNDFIIYIELKFENLIISRYLFEISKEFNTPIRNSVQITRFIIIKSKNKIMGTCVPNAIILCYKNDKDSNIILNNIIKELEKNYYIYLKLEEFIENTSDKIEKYLLSYIIQFTLVCKYLESGKWFHVWDSMDTIIESKFCGNNSCKYFNCIGFKFNVLNNDYNVLNETKSNIHIIKMYLKVTINIYKILPLDNICENMNVYCLPRCSMQATILNILDSSNNENFNYRDYWLDIHGYVLNEASIEKIVRVKLYKGVFNYPIGVLLRDNIYKIKVPIKKDHFFYICEFLNKFELLKNSKINLLKFSENLKFDNIYNDLNCDHIKLKNMENEDFFNKIKLLCNNEFDEKFIDEISNEGKQVNLYNNGYNIYCNTLSNSMKSINLNFSNDNKINKCNTSNPDKTIDIFLKESALNYIAADNRENEHNILNKNEDDKDDNSKNTYDNCKGDIKNKNAQNIYNSEKKNFSSTKDIDCQKKNNNLDKFLKDVTSNLKFPNNNNMKDIDFFENVNPDIIFSKDFQNFLDNLEEIPPSEEKLKKIDFNERDKKRPNFSINSQLNNENNDNNKKYLNASHQVFNTSKYGINNSDYVKNNNNEYKIIPLKKELVEINSSQNNKTISCVKNKNTNIRKNQNLFKSNQEKEKNFFDKYNENNHMHSSDNLNEKSNSLNLKEIQNMKKKNHIKDRINEESWEQKKEYIITKKKKI